MFVAQLNMLNKLLLTLIVDVNLLSLFVAQVNLVSMVPAGDASKEQLSLTLEKKKLSFLMPLLRIQAELKAALEKDPSPVAFFKLIKVF